MQNPTLFMLMLGFRPKNYHTEQHDIFFTIADHIADTEFDVKAFKPEAPAIHIDAWQAVTSIDGYRISVLPKADARKTVQRLFFINLGGYKEGEFDEFHYKILTVAKTLDEAKRTAKQSAFFLHTKAPGAPSHIDDKYGIDIDDTYEVKDILPQYLKDEYAIMIEEKSVQDIPSDKIHLGYQLYKDMKK